MAAALLAIGIIYFFAQLLSVSFAKTRVPDVLGLVTLGIVLGPVVGWVPPEAFGGAGPVLTIIALSVILFESGTTLNLATIFSGARHLLFLCAATSLITAAIVATAGVFLGGLSWLAAGLLGAIVCGTSSAIVIPMVKTLRAKDTPASVLTLESAITDVICIVATFGLLQAATQSEVQVARLVGGVIAAFGVATVFGFLAGLVWLVSWRFIRRIPNALFTTLAFGFIVYGCTDLLGFSGAIAVLAYGITLSNFKHFQGWDIFRAQHVNGITAAESGFYEEMVFLLKTFFFVYLGISMRFHSLRVLLIVVLILLVTYAARLLITKLATPGWNARDRYIVSIMIPKGLAAAVLAGLPLQAGIAGGEVIRDWAYQIVLISVIATSLLAALVDTKPARRFYARVFRESSAPAESGTRPKENDDPRQTA